MAETLKEQDNRRRLSILNMALRLLHLRPTTLLPQGQKATAVMQATALLPDVALGRAGIQAEILAETPWPPPGGPVLSILMRRRRRPSPTTSSTPPSPSSKSLRWSATMVVAILMTTFSTIE